MLDQLIHNWWAMALRGVIAIIFGVITLVNPLLSLTALILLFGTWMFVDGVFTVISVFTGRAGPRRGWLLLEGLTGLVAGLVTWFWPMLTALALVYLIAAWAIITGVFAILAAIQLRRVLTHEWMLIVSGLLSVVFAIVIAVKPGAGALGLTQIIGLYALIYGVLLGVLSWRLRELSHHAPTGVTPHAV